MTQLCSRSGQFSLSERPMGGFPVGNHVAKAPRDKPATCRISQPSRHVLVICRGGLTNSTGETRLKRDSQSFSRHDLDHTSS